ncbi:MAG TPA: cytochrome C biogenesis protein [Microscillaceae bacterium]|nr:cytochrome C biogenesis protein [Microscillaceae bacterium]
MKTTHIIGIVVIAIAISMIIAAAGDASQYVAFDEAFAKAQNGNNQSVHVVGKLQKNAQGKITGMEYNPQVDPNLFRFVMVDNKGKAVKVTYHSPKPTDLDRAEQVVVVGKARGKEFVASKILMKCPSKYEDGKIETIESEAKKQS